MDPRNLPEIGRIYYIVNASAPAEEALRLLVNQRAIPNVYALPGPQESSEDCRIWICEPGIAENSRRFRNAQFQGYLYFEAGSDETQAQITSPEAPMESESQVWVFDEPIMGDAFKLQNAEFTDYNIQLAGLAMTEYGLPVFAATADNSGAQQWVFIPFEETN